MAQGTWAARLGGLADRGLILQIIRYGITGGGVTILAAGVYWLLATAGGLPEQAANVVAWLCAVAIGFTAHSRWSFKGHGSRTRPMVMRARFFIVALIGLALNAFWVWLTVTWARGAEWWPIPLMIFVTPGIAFPLNRRWVFG